MICLLIERPAAKSLCERRIFDKKVIIGLSLYTRYIRRTERHIISVLIDSEASIGCFLVVLLRVLAELRGNILVVRNADTTFFRVKVSFQIG